MLWIQGESFFKIGALILDMERVLFIHKRWRLDNTHRYFDTDACHNLQRNWAAGVNVRT